MNRRWKRILIASAIVVASIAALAMAASALLPGWARGKTEKALTGLLGRRVTISGPFEISLIPEPGLSAGGIAIANAAWGSEPEMLRVSRLSFHLDPRALLSGRVHVRDVAIDGARVLLERNDAGRGNWAFDLNLPAKKPDAKPSEPVVVDAASIRDFQLTLRGLPQRPPLRLGVGTLNAHLDPQSRMVELEAGGHFNDQPWQVAGRLGTLDHLYAARDVEQALTGSVGGSTISIRGRFRDPFALAGPNVEIEIHGPDVAPAAAVFGVTVPATGPYRLAAKLSPVKDGVATSVDVDLGNITASARGELSALLDPARIGAEIKVAGPDATVIGGWIGLPGLPPGPFAVEGRLRRDAAGLDLKNVSVRAGRTTLTLDGTIGPLPQCLGTSLAIDGAGSDLAELSAVTRLKLPAGPFKLHGRFLRNTGGLALEDVSVAHGETSVHASGTIGEPPKLDKLAIDVAVSGPDLAFFDGIARTSLPHAPFSLAGRVARSGGAFLFEGVHAQLDRDTATIDGRLVPVRRAAGSEFSVAAAGPDLASATARWGAHGLPAVSYDVRGRVHVGDGELTFDGVEARAGKIEGKAGGRVRMHGLAGSTFAGRLHGPDLREVSVWGVPAEHLAADPFSASADVTVVDGGYRVERGTAEVGQDRATLSGLLGPALDITVGASGPDVSKLSRFVPSLDETLAARIPQDPYALEGRLLRSGSGIELSPATATIGGTAVRVEGATGSLRVAVTAPDASLAASLLGVTLPEGKLTVEGTVTRVPEGLRMDGVSVAIGEARVGVDGTLGRLPALAATDLSVSASGDDLEATLGPVSGLSPLPADPFEVKARLHGSREELIADGFAARLGGSDLAGTVSARLTEPRRLQADLRSSRLEIGSIFDGFVGETEPADKPADKPAKKSKRGRKAERVIPDQPLSLGALRDVDARIDVAVKDLVFPGYPFRDVAIGVRMKDGDLRVDPIAGTGRYGGHIEVRAHLAPSAGGYRAEIAGRLEDVRIVPEKSTIPATEAPPVDLDLDLEGEGRSPHEIAASSRGSWLAVLGQGKLPTTLGGFASSGLMVGLLDVLNPFRKSSTYTGVECGVAAAQIDGGKASVSPIALRTDKMTVLGKGKLDLGSEEIDLEWRIKPRKGVGITASSITNPYIKLGGTLAAPSIEAKPLEAATSTGAAVATAGLTLLFRGIYDRITAERKVCVNALEKAKKNAEAARAP